MPFRSNIDMIPTSSHIRAQLLHLALDERQSQRDCNDNSGEQLEVIRIHAQPEHESDHGTINDGAEHDTDQPVFETASAEEHFADDDRSEASDKDTGPHVDIGIAVGLTEQRAGDADKAIGNDQAKHDGDIGVDALRADHLWIVAGGADGSTKLGAEENVAEEPDDKRGQKADDQRRGNLTHVVFKKAVDRFFTQNGCGGAAHDAQVDRVQPDHREDPGEKRRDLELRVQKTSDSAGNASAKECKDDCQKRRTAAGDRHDGNGTAERISAFNRKIRDIQNAECDEKTDRQHGPQKPLGNRRKYEFHNMPPLCA